MDGESLRTEENGRQVGAQDTDIFTTSTIFLFTKASPELGILEGLVWQSKGSFSLADIPLTSTDDVISLTINPVRSLGLCVLVVLLGMSLEC